MFPSCHPLLEEHHSPINLDQHMVRNSSLDSLHLEGFDAAQPAGHWTLQNDGHSGEYPAARCPVTSGGIMSVFTCFLLPTVVLHMGSGMSVSGGGLPDVYHTVQLHFHWGAQATNGSEHTVDTRRYPMEVQYGQ